MGRFLIQINHYENATWQGTVQWIDKDVTQPFRSALELIKLMDSALGMQEKENQEK